MQVFLLVGKGASGAMGTLDKLQSLSLLLAGDWKSYLCSAVLPCIRLSAQNHLLYAYAVENFQLAPGTMKLPILANWGSFFFPIPVATSWKANWTSVLMNFDGAVLWEVNLDLCQLTSLFCTDHAMV